MSCHGCGGKGWISPSYGTSDICPICQGTGVAKSQYRPSTEPKVWGAGIGETPYWEQFPKTLCGGSATFTMDAVLWNKDGKTFAQNVADSISKLRYENVVRGFGAFG